MSTIGQMTSFYGGIASSEKLGTKSQFYFNRSTDFRSDGSKVTLLPKPSQDTGSLIRDLPMCMEFACSRIFAYDRSGNIYIKENDAWILAHSSPSSVGNGLGYFKEDRNLYYANNTNIGRLLEACTGSEYTDNFLEAEGGAPTNTKSLDLEETSSQGAYIADNAALSITGDLSLEVYAKPESLPATNEVMTLISKWDTNSDERSYKLDITTSSNFFGDGSDGALTISANTTDAPIDSACSGTSGTYTLSATNASFAAGQIILIHQTRGTNAGIAQRTKIQSYTAGTITTEDPLSISFDSSGGNRAQVLVLNQYTTITVDNGATWTAKKWNGTTGGILCKLSNTSFTNNGTIYAAGANGTAGTTGYPGNPTAYNGTGFYGGFGDVYDTELDNLSIPAGGEGIYGQVGGTDYTGGSNGGNNGGGAAVGHPYAAGSGGSNGGYGTTGYTDYIVGPPGDLAGSADLTTIVFGGGGGGSGAKYGDSVGSGGYGGGIVYIMSPAFDTSSGTINLNGGNGAGTKYGSSGGAGGSCLIKCQTATLGTNKITASGGSGSSGSVRTGANGGVGRIAVRYYTSYTGTTTPTLNATQDSSLGATDGYILRLLISNNGTASETYQWDITDQVDDLKWDRYQVTWDSSASTAIAYLNGNSLGERYGSMTSIYNSTSRFALGYDHGAASAEQNFFDGKIDDARVWNDVRTSSELIYYNDTTLLGTEPNLVGYWKFDDNLNDSQTNVTANNLTGLNSPTYSTDIPFIGLTDKANVDQQNTSGGFAATLTLPTSITESATTRLDFVPDYDPQQSILLSIDTVGTGDWTVTVHDPKNRVVATSTITNANLSAAYTTFTWSSAWRPILGLTYHIHITSTAADGKIDIATGKTTLSESDGTPNAYFKTFYQILVDDQYHPMLQFLNFMCIGNERYLATLEGGDVYTPHRLTLPSGERIRSLAYWREFIAIGTWSGEAITDRENGKVFFWDGLSDTYNFWINVPEGGINSLFGTRDILYIVAGYKGSILKYTGGGTADVFEEIPLLSDDDYIELSPNSMNMWQSMLHIGSNLDTNSTNIHQGVYTYGKLNADYPDSMGFSYPLSLGDQQSTLVKIGVIFPFGQEMYVGWQNGNAYGIDKFSRSNDCYATGTLELLITNQALISDDDFPLTLRADFAPLRTGEGFTVKYKADREVSWKTVATQTTVGATTCRGTINRRVKEIQIAVDFQSTGTSPELLGVTVENANTNERKA